MAVVNADHVAVVNRSTGPVGCLLSRTAVPLGRSAISTQAAWLLLRVDFRHTAGVGSRAMVPSFRLLTLVVSELRDHGQRLVRTERLAA